MVCPVCFNTKQLDKSGLLPNAELGCPLRPGQPPRAWMRQAAVRPRHTQNGWWDRYARTGSSVPPGRSSLVTYRQRIVGREARNDGAAPREVRSPSVMASAPT